MPLIVPVCVLLYRWYILMVAFPSAMNTLVLTSTAPTAAGSTCCRFSSKTVLNYFIAASSYGLMASTKYTYFIVYSS